MDLATIHRVRTACDEQQSVVLASRLHDAHQVLVDPAGDTELAAAAREALQLDRSHAVELDGEEWFLQVFTPPLRLLIVGAVHIGQHLAPIARQAGYAVTVIDPRGAFASAERFPETTLVRQWPERALEELRPDQRTAVVVLSHDPKIDDPALQAALTSAAFYVGALGSRRTHAGRLERLTDSGMDTALLERIHAPIGLDIGARSPAEIALSIVAEITQVLRRGAAS